MGEWAGVARLGTGGWAVAALATLAGAGIVGDMPASRPAALPPAGAVHTVAAPAGGSVWRPPQRADWMWELGQPLVTGSPRMMGTGVTAYNGDKPPGDNPVVYDIDGIQNPASTVAALHRRGDHVICYIEVGTAGNYYSAAQERIKTTYYAQLGAAGDLGRKLSGYRERFIDITARAAVSIIKSMIWKQCAQKGFDAVETDLDETFGNNEGHTGFTITKADEETYLTILANYMHALGLGWIAKNLDDTGRPSFVNRMEPLAQGIISEQCNQYRTCWLLRPFLAAHKWIGNAEYFPEPRARFCPRDNPANINGVLFNSYLDGGRSPCR
jgi:glycosyl hydrolase family 114